MLHNVDIEKIANDILDFLIANDLWFDVRIYFLNRAYCAGSCETDYSYSFSRTSNEITKEVFVIENISPSDYFDCGDILSISFEKNISDPISFGWVHSALNNMVKKYGLFFDFGNQWNMSLYHI